MKQKKRDKERILVFLERASWALDVANYQFTIEFTEHVKCEDTRPQDELMASIDVHHRYRSLNVKIHAPFFTHTRKIQCRALLHELCHAVTDKSAQLAYLKKRATDREVKDCNEHMTEQITDLIYKLSVTSEMDILKNAIKEYLKP